VIEIRLQQLSETVTLYTGIPGIICPFEVWNFITSTSSSRAPDIGLWTYRLYILVFEEEV